jgi:hypothetical protein
MNPDGTAPADNPFYDASDPSDPMNRYYAYGLRNMFGMTFDPLSGDIWFSDNGPTTWDELNRAVPGMNGGHNKIMGPDERDPQGVGDLWHVPGSVYVDPQLSWALPLSPTTVTFLDTPKLGCDYTYDMLVGTYNCRVIYRFELNEARDSLVFADPALADRVVDNTANKCADEQSSIFFATGPSTNSDQTTDIKVGPDGLVYLLSYSHHTLRRIVSVDGAWPDADDDGVDDGCDCDTSDAGSYGLPVEVPRIRPAGTGPTTLGWDPQSAPAGSGTSYTVVSGLLSDLHEDSGFAAACTLASGSTVPAAADSRALASGSGFYYLVRAENACGSGGFGAGTGTPNPREVIDADLPDGCL